MGRKPVFFKDADGDVSVRVKMPRPIWLVCETLGEIYEIRPDKALSMFLMRLGAVLSDQKQASSVMNALGPDIVMAINKTRQAHFGAIASGPQIDIERLHRSPKLKSGFVGVYPSGKGFRAEGRVVGSWAAGAASRKHLGTYDTAEEAAWNRLLYYEMNDLPYGVWEEAIDARRARGMPGSDAQLIYDFEDTNRLCGAEHLNHAPGRPKHPREDAADDGSKIKPLGFDGDGPQSLAELEAMNAARDEELRRRAQERVSNPRAAVKPTFTPATTIPSEAEARELAESLTQEQVDCILASDDTR